MADWKFTRAVRSKDFIITTTKATLGDAFSPPIPTDKLSTLNWNVKGTVKLYAADMTFIAEYGPGERMMVTDPAHLSMEKAVLIASLDVEYYCMSAKDGGYLDGEIITLAPDEVRTFMAVQGKSLFVGEGNISATKVYNKHTLLVFENTDEITVTAGAKGSILALFWKLPRREAIR